VKADQQVQETQKELDSLQAQLAGATSAAKRRTLRSTINELQGEVELFQARRDAIRNMLQFATGAGAAGPENLQAQIEALARGTPAATATAAPATVVTNQQKREEPSGIFGLITDLFQLRHKISALDDNLELTDQLAQSAKDLRQPLLSSMKDLTQKGDQVAAQADSADPATLTQERQELDSLTQQFKQVSATLLPLGKQSILLDVYKRSTTNWRNGIKSEYDAEMKGLLLRLIGLAVILGVVLGIAEVWRRATFRYITDPRRRYQFLLLRRILLWIVIVIIIFIAFASEIGSVTTFAGLMTAGIAVALQNVILSVAGYFFLIGKYGVRVGDRVQVSGITGDVVDIGLVRLHLMEVSEGPGPRPTGRVVVFSNAVVFQANAGLFKQIPGTHFIWHEITLSLARQSNYRDVEKCLMDAVDKIFSEYREKLETQRQNMERALNSVTIREFVPESRLHLTQAGVELVIRYPVELETAAEMDDRITREVLSALEREPHLRAHISGGPEKAEEQPEEVKK
jgi:small-conductance mechanosensitive channel